MDILLVKRFLKNKEAFCFFSLLDKRLIFEASNLLHENSSNK